MERTGAKLPHFLTLDLKHLYHKLSGHTIMDMSSVYATLCLVFLLGMFSHQNSNVVWLLLRKKKCLAPFLDSSLSPIIFILKFLLQSLFLIHINFFFNLDNVRNHNKMIKCSYYKVILSFK